jgi:hypothetical protein
MTEFPPWRQEQGNWGTRVFFLYPMRRVDCIDCGVRVEEVPWAKGKNQLTTTYRCQRACDSD